MRIVQKTQVSVRACVVTGRGLSLLGALSVLALDAALQGAVPSVDDAVKPRAQGEQSAQSQAPAAAIRASQVPVTESAVIRFEPPELDLGEMLPEVAKTGIVKLINISDKPVKITRVIPIGTYSLPTPKDPIPVGGYIEIPVTMKPGSKQGVGLSKRCVFFIENSPSVILTVKGQVLEFIKITPEMLTGPAKRPQDEPELFPFTMKSVDGTPFRIYGANSSIIESFEPEARTELTLYFDFKKWQAAGKPKRIQLVHDHPKMDADGLVILIEQASEPAEARPRLP